MKFFARFVRVVPFLLTACTNAPDAKNPPTDSVNPAGANDEQRTDVTNAGGDAVVPNAPTEVRLYVGSGDWGTATGAISVFSYDPATGALRAQSRVDAGGLLSFLATDGQHRFLYAADEEQKKLRSFAIKGDDGSLTPLATTDTIAGAVYVNVTRNDRFILGAQFNSGKTEVFELDERGGFGVRTAEVASGKESHGVFLSPDEKFAFVPGRGSDQVQAFSFDANTGTLRPAAPTPLPKGAGCRHFDFHPNGKFAYLINEFANTIVTFSYDAASGRLSETQTVSTNPDAGVQSSAADIHVHPNGKFLYATNRPVGTDGSIVVYSVAEDGRLSFVQKESTHGSVPRNFHIVVNGTRLVVGNQESKSVQSYSIDSTSGLLTAQALTPIDVKPFFISDL